MVPPTFWHMKGVLAAAKTPARQIISPIVEWPHMYTWMEKTENG